MSGNPWNNKTASIAIVVAFLVGLFGALALREGGGAAVTSTSDTVRAAVYWRVPVAFGTNLPALGDNILYVRDALADATNARIEFEVFEPGMLVPPFSITEAVGDGKIDAGYTWVGYDQGRIPATPLISAVPFGMEPWEYAAWYYEDDGRALTRELYRPHDVMPLLCGVIGPETAGWFRQPINSVEDFEGLKIRFAGLGGRVLQRLGASVTLIPGSEIFQALEKGAIDATEFSLPAVDQRLGFDRVAPYNYFPGWHQTFTAAHLVVNLDTWESLPEADRALIEMACTAGVIRNLSKAEAIQGPVISNFESRGVTTAKFPLSVLRRLEAVTEEVLAEEAARDEMFRKIQASQDAFMKRYRPWKDHAYLPRDFKQPERSSQEQ
ncbi:MAG: TRAP transporter substrate-binding protein [Gammaproteobacteria bacterium]|nr:TRAP transporter substrate-binding protein [Gammaproteobacteria bacterium]